MPGFNETVYRTVLPVLEYGSHLGGAALLIDTDASGNQTLAVQSPAGVRQTVRSVLMLLADNEVARQAFLDHLDDLIGADTDDAETIADDMADELARAADVGPIAAQVHLPRHVKAAVGLTA